MASKRKQETRSIAVGSPLGDNKLFLKAFTATEHLGRPFRIELELLSEDGGIVPTDILGQNMTVRVDSAAGHTRFFNGQVARWHQSPPSGGMARYRATLVPWIWFLSRAADCRIFQEMSIPDIILQVFRDQGFSDFEKKLNESYPALEYVVQYRETDLNFVSRLMEQAGIYYFFKHENGKHTLILADSIGNHVVYPNYPEIRYHEPEPQIVGKEYITDFFVEQHVQTGRFMHTDFDFTRPTTNLETKLTSSVSHTGSGFEVFDYPGQYTETSDGDSYAKVRLQEFEADFEAGHGQSDSQGIVVGSKFTLADFPRESYNKEWMVKGTTIHAESDSYEGAGGSSGGLFSCRFEVIDATVQYRSPRVTPKPLISGPQTAIVVGKSGEEIWTDQYGRVKVYFHWDRAGSNDETASCWVRVAQVWAGKKWGGMHIPRIGQEVIVEFLEGDPDRPIITGRVYNGVEMPPYALPDNATRSGIKSNSSKGGGGFNEIRFEDKKDEEQIFIHAERNEDVRVKNDSMEWIGNDRHLMVENNQHEQVEVDKHQIVKGNQYRLVEGEDHTHVKGDRFTLVDGAEHEVFKSDQMIDVTGGHNLKVGGDVAVKASGTVSHDAGKDTMQKSAMNHAVDAGMEVHIKGGMKVIIEAGMQVTLKGAGGVIDIGPTGIAISGTMVMINSGGAAGSGSGCSALSP
ncbi:MAG: type VI secretion system Vgr family protein, partial [Phycisphaerales bacterium]